MEKIKLISNRFEDADVTMEIVAADKASNVIKSVASALDDAAGSQERYNESSEQSQRTNANTANMFKQLLSQVSTALTQFDALAEKTKVTSSVMKKMADLKSTLFIKSETGSLFDESKMTEASVIAMSKTLSGVLKTNLDLSNKIAKEEDKQAEQAGKIYDDYSKLVKLKQKMTGGTAPTDTVNAPALAGDDLIQAKQNLEAQVGILQRITDSRHNAAMAAENELKQERSINKSLDNKLAKLKEIVAKQSESGTINPITGASYDRNESDISVDTDLINFSAQLKEQLESQVTWWDKLKQKVIDARSNYKSATDTINENSNALNNNAGSADKANRGFSGLIKRVNHFAVSYRIFSGFIGGIGRSVMKLYDNAAGYEEAMNLYRTSFGDMADAATKWADRISTALYLDPKDIMQYAGAFYNLVSGLGVGSEAAYKMATNLTQLSYDMSSYLNIDQESAYEKVTSAITGQSRAVVTAGVAMQAASLQETAYSLGIEKKVATMTQAEKTYLRYIQIMNQTKDMQQDLGKTIVTPENALRLMRNQFTLLGRAIGNVFVPIILKAIPYVMAFTQVLTTLANKLANWSGYKIQDVDYSGIQKMTGAMNDLGDSASGAGGKVNRTLAAFDDLNVVESKSSGSGGAGAGGSVISDLEKYIDGYDMLGKLTADMDKNVEKAKENLMGIAKVLGVVAGVVGAFKLISTVGNTIQWLSNTGSALKTVMSFFGVGKTAKGATGAVTALKGSKDIADSATGTSKSFNLPSFKTVLKGLGELTLVVGATVLFVESLGLLTRIPGFKENISTGIWALKETFNGIGSIALPLAAMVAGINVLSKVNAKSIALGLADLAVVIGGTVGVITAIGAVMSIPYFMTFLGNGIKAMQDTFNGIADIALPLLAVTSAFALVGLAGGAGSGILATGLADFAIVVGGTVGVITAIGALMSIPGFMGFLDTGIDAMQKCFNGIADVALPLIGVTSALTLLGLTGGAGALTILAGLGNFALIIGGIEVVIAAIGALCGSKGFQEAVSTGFDVLAGIGEGIGKFAGAIVGGFASFASNSLPAIGTNLSGFAANAHVFFEESKGIDATAMQGVKYMADALLTLTGTGILDSLTSWFTGGNSLANFGDDLVDFGPKFKKYAKSIEGIDAKVVNASTNAAKSLAAFAKELPNQGGMVSWFTGDNTLDKFASYLPKFGESMKKYYGYVKDVKSDVIEGTGSAAQTLAEFAKKLPNQGGMVSWFTGDNRLDTFAKYLPDFGKNIKKYADNILGMDPSVVNDSATAAKALAEMANNLPNQGGIVSWFTGDNKLSDFGADLAVFGGHFKSYYDKIKGVDAGKVDSVSKALSSLVSDLKTIKDKGLNDVLKNFGNSLSSASSGITDYFKNAFSTKVANDIGGTFGKTMGEKIKSTLKDKVSVSLKVTNSSGKNVDTYSIKAYAKGGFPTAGDLFLANEAGPEFITSIGNKSAVANQDQMVQALTNAILVGMSKIPVNNQPGVTQVYIGNDKVYEGQGTYQNRQTDRYGVNTIRI